MKPKEPTPCAHCGMAFVKRRPTTLFCSRPCAFAGRNFANLKPHKKQGVLCHCLNCGTQFYVPAYRALTAKYCSRSCLAKQHFPQFSGNAWQSAGTAPHRYRKRRINGRLVYEHRYLMEQHLGRNLTRNEHVHHINGNSLDNRIENLEVLTNSEHQKRELAMRAAILAANQPVR